MPKNIYKEQNEELKAEAERLRLEIMRLTQKIEIALSILLGSNVLKMRPAGMWEDVCTEKKEVE